MAWYDILNPFGNKKQLKVQSEPNKGIDQRPKVTNLPAGRTSKPNEPDYWGGIMGKNNKNKIVYPPFLRNVIPEIRRLMINNPDVGQVIHNIVSLGNTGHKISFDKKVSPEEVDKMRNHLVNRRKTWATGSAGMNGVINKMFAQLLIGGALSTEWVPEPSLKGIQQIVFVNPEDIEFALKTRGYGYDIYQKLRNPIMFRGAQKERILLNPATYKYFALNGDTDIPYGFPPYTSVLPRINTQNNMHTNIDFVVDQLGIIGFLEALIEKPDPLDGVDDMSPKHTARLNALLEQAKTNIMGGVKDGVIVGYKGDHEFKFNSFGKDYDNVNVLFKNNELQIASALKQDATLWGRDYNTSETQITVVFMKMLSELRNIQNLIKENLEFGYTLELLMAGYKFEYLQVNFNRSTIQDDLKYQQAEEIKIRNVKDKYILGVISEDTMADELGYETYDSLPRVPIEVLAGKGSSSDNAAQKKNTKEIKKKSDKKVRDKNKPTGSKK